MGLISCSSLQDRGNRKAGDDSWVEQIEEWAQFSVSEAGYPRGTEFIRDSQPI